MPNIVVSMFNYVVDKRPLVIGNSVKCDVFSFGVLLFETICVKKKKEKEERE